MFIFTRWASAVVPIRVRGMVVAVPVEQAGIGAVVQVTATTEREDRTMGALGPYSVIKPWGLRCPQAPA